MKKNELLEFKSLINSNVGILNNGLNYFINQTVNSDDEIDLCQNTDVFDGFHEIFLLTKKYDKAASHKLNFMQDTEILSNSNKKLLLQNEMLELRILHLESLLEENNITY